MDSQFQDFTVEQLVMHGQFQQWVKHPDQKLNSFWTAWINENPTRKEMVEEARRLILSIDFPDDLADAEVEEEWAKMQTLLQQPSREAKVCELGNSRNRLRYFYPVAAVFIALLVSIWVLYTFIKQVPQIEYATAFGEVKSITLPDGSTVVLNANSKVHFAQKWDSEDPREVWLEGEAYFSVTHQANDQKFIVRTSAPFSVEVLGTTFTVNKRNGRNRVVLNSGKVRLEAGVSGTQKTFLMQPGDLIEVVDNSKVVKKQVNPEEYAYFKVNKIQFNNTPLREIALQLKDLYGLDVQFDNKQIASREFTGTFPIDKPNLLLRALSRTYNLKINRAGNNLILESLPSASNK